MSETRSRERQEVHIESEVQAINLQGFRLFLSLFLKMRKSEYNKLSRKAFHGGRFVNRPYEADAMFLRKNRESHRVLDTTREEQAV